MTPKEAHGARIQTKRGAMFGLDARIALAIFGALSVISGAALYSAIQDAKATSLFTDMNEVFKAWESYLLDNGQEPPKNQTDFSTYQSYIYKATELVVNNEGLTTWKGPYLQYSSDGGTGLIHKFTNSAHSKIHIIITKKDDFGASDTAWFDSGLCVSGKKCYLTIQYNGFDDDSIAKYIDSKYDNNDGRLTGRFRWYEHATQGYHYIYQIQHIKNPHD